MTREGRKQAKLRCEGTTTRAHPHAFGHRVTCACTAKAKYTTEAGNFCGRCIKKPIKWGKLVST